MRIIPASNTPFLPFNAGGAPVFPAGVQPLLYLHHQYGFATDGSEWLSRVGTAKATQPNPAKRPTVTAGGLYSDGTKAMQTGVLPLAAAPAVTALVAFSLPLGASLVLLETGPDYHAGGAFNLFSESGGRLYTAAVMGAENAEAINRTTGTDTVTLRYAPPGLASLSSQVNGAGYNYYFTGPLAYGLIDNVLNLFARNNGSGPVGLSLKQVLLFPAMMTDADLAPWQATF